MLSVLCYTASQLKSQLEHCLFLIILVLGVCLNLLLLGTCSHVSAQGVNIPVQVVDKVSQIFSAQSFYCSFSPHSLVLPLCTRFAISRQSVPSMSQYKTYGSLLMGLNCTPSLNKFIVSEEDNTLARIPFSERVKVLPGWRGHPGC